MSRIAVLGAGFAGLWAALGAARKRDEIGAAGRNIEILMVDRNPYHNIRVRNYEVDLGDVAIPLSKVLDPVCVAHRVAEVEAIDSASREVRIVTGGGHGGALYTEGWDREVRSTGATAKKTKQTINRMRIYPPLTGNREELLAAAASVIQAPPPTYGKG